jgi:dTMP kinase
VTSGRFIAIEGGDGSGKGTQCALLKQYLESIGYIVGLQSFPRHGMTSAYYTDQYLNGAYGEADAVSGDLAGLAYAVDRFAAKSEMMKQLSNPKSILLADRYVSSNLAHQGTKFSDPAERKAFYERTMNTEYEILGIPRPSINIVLIMPTDLAQLNVDKKAARGYTDKKRDIHEADVSHLDRAKANYEELCRLYPDDFRAIQCVGSDGTMRSIDDIQGEIRLILHLQ